MFRGTQEFCRIRLTVRSDVFQASDMGSTPLCGICRSGVWCIATWTHVDGVVRIHVRLLLYRLTFFGHHPVQVEICGMKSAYSNQICPIRLLGLGQWILNP